MTRTPSRYLTPSRWFVAMLALGLILAACSSSSDDATTTTSGADGSTTTTTAATDDSSSEDTVADDGADDAASDDGASDDGSGGAGVEYATVTLDGVTYESDLSASLAVCVAMGGAVGGAGPITGLDDGSVDLTIPPEDWETSTQEWDAPYIRLDLGEDESGTPVDWRAGGDIIEQTEGLDGKSQVDSFTIDGTTATGSATFIDFFQWQLYQGGQIEEPEPVVGTFEVSCG